MKKIILSLLLIVFPATYILFHCTTVNAALYHSNSTSKGIAKFDGSKIVAWKQLDQAKVTLSNGQVIAEANTKNTLDTVKLRNPVDICFILDDSGSMSGSKIQTLKSATKTLIENLRNKYDNAELLRIAIIIYSNNARRELEFTLSTNENEINSVIAKLVASGGTATEEAVDLASQLWNENNAEENTYKYNILITDGKPNHTEATKLSIENFKNNHNDIKFLSIFVGSKTDEIERIFASSDDLIYTSNEKFSKTIIDGIWNFIFWNYIDADNITTTENASNVFYGDDSYIAIIDEELIYGATIELKYSIHIKTVEKLELIKVVDYLAGGLTCKTSNYEGKYLDDNTIGFEISEFNGEEGDNYDEEIVIELCLSRVLSSEDDVEYIKNTADVAIKTADGKVFTTADQGGIQAASEGDNNSKIYSKKFQILPPFGQRRQDKIKPYIETSGVILTVSTMPIINKIRKNKKG